MTTSLVRIRTRRDTRANWTSANPVLGLGELGLETDTGRVKAGDNATLWASLPYLYFPNPHGSRASPVLITAVGGIGVQGYAREYQFVKGNGGPVTVTATPQIQAGAMVGQELILQGRDNTATVKLANGNGLTTNGDCTLRDGSSLHLIWDGSFWVEVARNDV